MEMKEALLLLWLSIFHSIQLSSSFVTMPHTRVFFPDLPAKFARDVDSLGFCGALYMADPLDACSRLRNPLEFNQSSLASLVLIIRGECSFEDKIQNAQNAGFGAAIVYDNRNNSDLVNMVVTPGNILVHAVFVSNEAGEVLKEHSQWGRQECCIYSSRSDNFFIALGLSFITVTVIVVVLLLIAYCTPRRWLRWHATNVCTKSIDTKMLEALPRFTFSSARSSQCHVGETCAICLEDYKDGEVLRVLPCKHEFHSVCVDSWLTKWGRSCPVCKLDVKSKFESRELTRGILLPYQ